MQIEGRIAPAARAIALAVVAIVAFAERAPSELCLWRAVGRVAWCALFGRPGRIYGAKASWRSVWLGQIDGPYTWCS